MDTTNHGVMVDPQALRLKFEREVGRLAGVTWEQELLIASLQAALDEAAKVLAARPTTTA